MFDAGCYVGIATHDEWLIAEAKRIVAERGLDRGQYEFQMLLGVRPRLGDALVAEGHRLRIYVPFGSHWYEYSLRRLQENPSIAGYIASDTIGRVLASRTERLALRRVARAARRSARPCRLRIVRLRATSPSRRPYIRTRTRTRGTTGTG